LEAVVRENTKNRGQELALCRQIISELTTELMERLNAAPAKRGAETIETVPSGLLCGA
jgi:hypothetical protein